MASTNHLIWVEISRKALVSNVKIFQEIIAKNVILCPSVKANAYGHGLIPVAKILTQAGVPWLSVNSIEEALGLRKAGIKIPIYILGYVPFYALEEAARNNFRIVLYNNETLGLLEKLGKKLKKKIRVHVKIDTGTSRQGLFPDAALDFCARARKSGRIDIEGISMHFANIEDTLNDAYAKKQLREFQNIKTLLDARGFNIPFAHCANSAATLLYPETHFNFVRPGISIYGLWPSPEARKKTEILHRQIKLKPVLSWKTKIAQVKEIPKNTPVGYGCTYVTKRKTRLAILPVGYYDGYDRGLSNKGSALVHGKRAKILGRVCMNIIMADITEIPKARLESEVTLLGKQGKAEISAEEMGELIDTINYEITTRINEKIPRIAV